MRRLAGLCVVAATLVGSAQAQTPQPFPRAGVAAAVPSSPGPQAPRAVTVQSAPAGTPSPASPATPQAGSPTPAELGFPVYPASQFLASFDAGRGQRYYIFGTTAAFVEIVNYYRTQLNERGNLVFREPPTHMFEVGRFREDAMAFPPGVTVKDWTWGGSAGYANPKLGAQPARFPTVIMIVPAPAAPAPAASGATAPGATTGRP